MRLPASIHSIRPVLAALLAGACLSSAALAETVTVSGIEVTGADGFRLSVPSVEMTDANIDEMTLRAIFSGDFAGTADALANLDAAEIRIPELSFRANSRSADGEVVVTEATYTGIVITDIDDGVAGRLTIAGSETSMGEGESVSLGSMQFDGLDIGAMLAFYGLVEAQNTGFSPFLSGYDIAGMNLVSAEVSCDFGAMRGGAMQLRPLATPPDEIFPLLHDLGAMDEPDPESLGKVLAFVIDLFTAFSADASETDGFTCAGTDDDGKAIAISGGATRAGVVRPGIYPEVAIDDFRIDVTGEGYLAFGNFTLKPVDFTTAVAALEAAPGLDEAWFTRNWRSLVPAMEGLSGRAFAIDVPDEDSPGQRVQASIGEFDVTLGDYVNGIPSAIALRAGGIELAMPPEARELQALGLDRLNLGYDIALHWNEADETILIDRAMLSGVGMGAVTLSGRLGNAGPDLFSEDLVAASAASAGLTLLEADIEIVDAGISDALIAMAAAEQGQPPAAFRAILSGLAQALPFTLLGATPEATALGTELRAFVDGKPNLRLTLRSVDPAGIGLAELEAAQQNPTTLSGKLVITAAASGEAPPASTPGPAAPQAAPAAERQKSVPPAFADDRQQAKQSN